MHPTNSPQPLSLIQTREQLRARQIFGTPGASLTWGIEKAKHGDVAMGLEGEKMTARYLDAYTTTHPGVYVFHSTTWPGSEQHDTDHLVLRGDQVILVDSKRWKAKRKYSVTPTGAILRGTVRFPEGRVRIQAAKTAWQRALPNGARISAVVCIAQEKVFVPYDDNWKRAPFRLVAAENLPEMLDRLFSKPVTPNGAQLEPHLARLILPRLVTPKPPRPRIDFNR